MVEEREVGITSAIGIPLTIATLGILILALGLVPGCRVYLAIGLVFAALALYERLIKSRKAFDWLVCVGLIFLWPVGVVSAFRARNRAKQKSTR
jgi:hypothetical protein